MNVCFVINDLRVGGAEKLLVEVMRRWGRRPGWRYSLVLKRDSVAIPDFAACHPESVRVLRSGRYVSAILELRSILRKGKFDICVSHLERPNRISSIASLAAGIPSIAVVHSMNVYPAGSRGAWIARQVYNHCATRVVAVSDDVAQHLRAIGVRPRKITVIPNGVDYADLSARHQYRANSRCMELLFVGRIEPVKNLPLLLNALKEIDLLRIPWRLTVVGHGSQETQMRELARDLRIAAKIEFTGQLPDPWEMMGNSWALCFTSLREGLPMALLEGLSVGLPVIASNVGSLPRFVTAENGFLFATGRKEALVDALRRLAESPLDRLRDMSCASRRIARRYDIQTTVASYEQLVRDVSGN